MGYQNDAMNSSNNHFLKVTEKTNTEIYPWLKDAPDSYLFSSAIQDALNEVDWPSRSEENTIILWDTGCRAGSAWNCTAACLDPSTGPQMVWNAPDAMYTLQNCLVYPILATAAADGWLVEDPHGLLEKYNIIVNHTLPTRSNSTSGHIADAWPVVNACTQAFCTSVYANETYDGCALNDSILRANYTMGSAAALWNPTLSIDADFCDMGPLTLNADIGGPGVLGAYFQQLAIVFAVYFYVGLPKWVRFLKRCHKRVHMLFHPPERRRQRTCAGHIAAPCAKRVEPDAFENIRGATFTTLLDFQKAQIAFASVMQVVSVISLSDPSWLGAATMNQLGLGLSHLVSINVLSIITVALSLLALRKDKGARFIPGFTLFTSSCSIIISCAIVTRTITGLSFDPGKLQQTGLNPIECGGWNPMRHCRANTYWAIEGSGLSQLAAAVTVGFTYQAVFLLALEWSIKTGIIPPLTRRISAKDRYNRLRNGANDTMSRAAIRRLGDTAPFTLALYEGWLFVEGVLSLWNLVALYSSPEYAYGRRWSLGQILAVSVWIPVMIEWIYLAILGIEKGFSIRLARGYRVVRQDGDETGNGHDEYVNCCCYLPGTELASCPPSQTDSNV